MKIRYIKTLRDIASDYARSLTLVLAIAVGVVGVGSILGGYAVISREMTANYTGTSPAEATIELEGEISRALVDSVRAMPNIRLAARRATRTAKLNAGGKWYPLLLFVIDDFNKLEISRFRHVSGKTEPPTGTMLMERTALRFLHVDEGERVTVKMPNGTPMPVQVVGTVHDPSLAPAQQEQAGYAYITEATLRQLGETQGFDQLKIRLAEGGNSVGQITTQAKIVANWLGQRGHKVHEIQVPPPNKHPHQGQMNTMQSIFVVFSLLLMVLASILVSASVATIMVKQVRQIGVMKTIGASSRQIARLYLFMILVFSGAALLIGIPLSWVGASILSNSVANLLNLELVDKSIPVWVAGVQAVAGVVIPLLAVAGSVIRGSRVSVRSALDNFGVSATRPANSGWVIRLSNWFTLSETARLSVRNVFRQPARLLMTLGLLAAGGAMFMTALNVSAAWDTWLDQLYAQRLYDLEIRLSQPLPQPDSALARLRAVAGVRRVEAHFSTPVSYADTGSYAISRTYPDKGHGSFKLQALALPTQLIKPRITAGSWLNNPQATDVVLNQSARKSGVKIGDWVVLSVGRKTVSWRVVGFSEDVGMPATAYVSTEALEGVVNTDGLTPILRLAFTNRDKAFARSKMGQIERVLEHERASVSSSVPTWLVRNAVSEHMKILVNALLAMAVLMALVGSLALFSTMSMNVYERTREIGVMRAIGATPVRINALILWEGLLIGFLSLLPALILSLILSFYLGGFVGRMSFGTPLSLTVSSLAGAVWIGIIGVGSYLATLYPARRASRMTTREALAYE